MKSLAVYFFPWCCWTEPLEIQATSSPHPGLFSTRTITRVGCVVCSLLGLTVSGYFYCGCLFYLFVKSDSLRQVLTAVRLGGEEMNLIMCYQIITLNSGYMHDYSGHLNDFKNYIHSRIFYCSKSSYDGMMK